VKKSLTSFQVVDVLVPCIGNHIHESRHFDPYFFKPEGFWFLGATIACKENGTMIGQGGRKGVKDVVGEVDVPFFIAKESVKLAQSRVLLLIDPSEFWR
jgi:hypothetical protein